MYRHSQTYNPCSAKRRKNAPEARGRRAAFAAESARSFQNEKRLSSGSGLYGKSRDEPFLWARRSPFGKIEAGAKSVQKARARRRPGTFRHNRRPHFSQGTTDQKTFQPGGINTSNHREDRSFRPKKAFVAPQSCRDCRTQGFTITEGRMAQLNSAEGLWKDLDVHYNRLASIRQWQNLKLAHLTSL